VTEKSIKAIQAIAMDRWIGIVSGIEKSIERGLTRIACSCALYPKRTLAVTTVILLGFSMGMITLQEKSKGTELWADQNGEPIINQEYADTFYPRAPRLQQLLITADPHSPTANLLTRDVIRSLFVLHDQYEAISVDGHTLRSLCITAGRQCDQGMQGVLGFWDFNSTLFEATVNNDDDVRRACTAERYVSQFPVNRDLQYADFAIDSNGRASASTVMIRYTIIGQLDDGSFGQLEEWEKKWLEVTEKFSANGIIVYRAAQVSLDVELGKAVGNDISLIAISYMLMAVFASLTMGKAMSKLRSRSIIATIDVLLIVLATGAAYGICGLAGVSFTSLTQILPFILVAIGIDDAFVLSSAFDATDESLPMVDRITKAMSHAGMAITVTSATDLLAFSLGSITRIPAVQWFCIYAAVSILLIYLLHLTAFVALLVLDSQRVAARRADICCCVCLKVDDDGPSASSAENPNNWIRKYYAPALLHRGTKAAVLAVFTGWTVYMGILASDLGTDFDLKDLTPDSSYLREFYVAQEDTFGSSLFGIPTRVYFKDVDYSDASVQAEIEALSERFLDLETVSTSIPLDSWHRDFSGWAIQQLPYNTSLSTDGQFVVGNQFIPAVIAFLQQPQYQRHVVNVILNDDNSQIVTSRVSAFHVDLAPGILDQQAFTETSDLASSSTMDPKPFILAPPYPFFEQQSFMVSEMVTNLALCLVAVIVVCSVTLIHPLAVAIITFVLCAVFIDLLGSLALWGLDLNTISGINLIMAIGLVVDYSSHIATAFGHASTKLSRDERMTDALVEIGPPVLLGLATTMIGILPLAFASSTVFRVFFKMFVSIVIVGGLHGLVVLPVILSLIGPAIPSSIAPDIPK